MFNRFKKDILGDDYSLSIAYVGLNKSREFNKKYRGKDKPTNVLAFPLSKNSGEILLCREVIRREGWNVNFLVIHGMLHLKGMRHGSRMDRAEKFYCAKYDQKYIHRNRRGVLAGASGSGRKHARRKKS